MYTNSIGFPLFSVYFFMPTTPEAGEELRGKVQSAAENITRQYKKMAEREGPFSIDEQVERYVGLLGDDGIRMLREELASRGVQDLIEYTPPAPAPEKLVGDRGGEKKMERKQVPEFLRCDFGENTEGDPVVLGVNKVIRDDGTIEEILFQTNIQWPENVDPDDLENEAT